jgi:uncharacterized BrkB/YihY/UPF0761 family membrane protein
MWKEETERQRIEKERKIIQRRRSRIHWSFGTISLFFALMPTWISILLYHFTGPGGFMEKLAFIGLAFYIAGGFQLFLLGLWIWFMLAIVLDM